MRRLMASFLLVLTIILSQQTSAQSATITFRASIKSNDNTSLPNVYVRIYGPEVPGAVDSLFSDEEGNIEQQLPFSWSGPNSIDNMYASQPIVAPMTPNMISGATPSVRIEYNYPSGATLIFTDIQGKRQLNGSQLASGLYFYFLEFEDGTRSVVQKMLLAERCNVNVELINLYQGYAIKQDGTGLAGLQSPSSEDDRPKNAYGSGSPEGTALKRAPLEELFYVEFIKEGFVTFRDTIQINSAVIEKNYQLQTVDPPSAAFSWTGELLAGKPVIFDATTSTGAYGEELVYAWDFGDGKKGQSAGIPHIFIAPGSYEVKLTVSGSYGATHHTSQTVTILADQSATQFSGTVIGSITDMDGIDLKDVLVTLVEEEQNATTDHRGMAVLEDLPMGIPLHLRINKEGYVTQVVALTIPEATGEAVFFATLKERAPAVTLPNAEFGGSLSGTDGASFTLPVRGLIREDGSAAEGDVTVSLTPVDVAFDAAAFPGSFTGYRTDGAGGVLLSYGVAEFHFEQDGESLQLAPGKQATIEIPVYTSGASVGDEIPLWSVDEQSGTWVEEGTGTIVESDASPTGLAYRAGIGHLSWWNCDDFDEEKKRDGHCYILDCTSAICVRLRVGCWMSGAMRDKKKSVWLSQTQLQAQTKAAQAPAINPFPGEATKSIVEREDIPPVFEVREFVPESGQNLRFPANSDVLLDARAFGPGNQLFGGRFMVEASNDADTFSIELVQISYSDTINLELNSFMKHYLDPDEVLTFRVEIPEQAQYRFYAVPGESPRLTGLFSLSREDEVLLSDDIGFGEHWINLEPGTYSVSIAGEQSYSEGNFIIGITERYPVVEGDTIALVLNTLTEGSLQMFKYAHYRVEIPVEGRYRIYAEEGDPRLLGKFTVSMEEEELLSGDLGTGENWVNAGPGTLFITVAGRELYSEGNFIVGISKEYPMLEGDTLSLALNATAEGYLEASEYKHFRVDIPVAGLYRVDLKYGSSPSLIGRFEVRGSGDHTYRFLTTDDHGYILVDAGDIILSVAGKDLKQAGNFIIGIWDINAVPVALNDSLNVMMPETDKYHMYSIQSPVNTLVDCRFYQLGDLFVSGKVSLISPTGRRLDQGNLYTPGARIVQPMAGDSMYYFEVERNNLPFAYVLLPAEEVSVGIDYGDTVNERLRYKGDKDLYHFDAMAGEVVSVRGFQPDYQLSKGYFSLWSEAGKGVATRDISYNTTLNDYEIVYEIPESGRYSIIVGAHQGDTGSYQVILQDIVPVDIPMDELTAMDLEPSRTYYAGFELTGSQLVHLALRSDNGSGLFHLWDASGNRLTEFNNYHSIKNFYNGSYTGWLPAGKYFIRIDNTGVEKLYVNLAKPQPISFDEKGKAAFTEAFDQAYRIRAYSFSGYRGDGVHGILKRSGSEPAPDNAELKYFRMSGAGSPLYPEERSGAYYSLDDRFLHESATRLQGEMEDTVFVVVAAGTTEGTFDFIFHWVDAAADIAVDDDFVQYPEAQTSSHIAAGYAVGAKGSVQIANGEYSSILPMTIDSYDVTLSGQAEEHVLLRNLYNYTNNPVIYFSSEWGNVSNLGLSCGFSNYCAIETRLEGITLDHIQIKPLEGEERVGGGIKGVGNNMSISYITMTNSIWGIAIGSNGALIEHCDLKTENCAIELTGEDIVIRDNQLEVSSSNRAISTNAGFNSSGSQLIEGNTIHVTRDGYATGRGIINIENLTGPAHTTTSLVKGNTIHSAGSNAAYSLTLGNPPSTIAVEGNTYYGTYAGGGKALVLQAGRSDGVSSIIVSNNTFSGMSSEGAIMLYGAEYINEDERFAIYNNSFRFSADAAGGADRCFVEARSGGYSFTDTAQFYLVNNIFQGNGTTTLFKFSDDFSIYADYNTVYNFDSYHGGIGNIIGGGHDVTEDPLFTDDDLHLDPASQAVDKGADPTLFPGIPVTDKEGVARPQGGGYDMGAYER
jgi:PKD repeat protein